MNNDVLNEKQIQAIELLAKGETISDVAKMVGVSRQSVSTWKNNNKVFKDELAKYVQGLKSGIDTKIMNNIHPLVDRLIKIALKSKSDKTSLEAIEYALNRVLGTPTNKTQDVTTVSADDSKPADINALIQEIQDVAVDQVVKLPKAN